MKPSAAEIPLHDRVAHIEGEVGSIHLGMDRLTETLEKVWEKIDGLSTRGQPSWQAIVAFGFSAISAVVTVAGVVGVVIAMFVRQETGVLAERMRLGEADRATLNARYEKMREEKIVEQRETIRELSGTLTR